MNLIIVRHGQTEENLKGIVQGNNRGTLSEFGKKQVKDVAKELSIEHIDEIYSSDLKRCADTVVPIAEYHKKVPLVFSDQLREITIGSAGKLGLRFPVRFANFGLNLAILLHIKIPGGESWKDLRNRVSSFLNEIYGKYPNETVLLVTHGITMRAIRSLLTDPITLKKTHKDDVPNCVVWKMQMNKKLEI
jgi:broad specificity phosphatase PhoE